MLPPLAVLPQYLFPKQALTAFAGWVAGHERGWVTTAIIRRFVRKYNVNMDEALDSNIASYASFNDFFTRALKPGGRIAYVEYRLEDQRVPIKTLHKMSEAQVRKEAAAHALMWERTASTLPWQHVVIFRKK